ncbi:MAG: hypothetical protein OET44_09685 [Gammaproteobacteria bacterium]|nr:hypothetical protein [Gammaproteobacteria bacterium]
MVIVLFLIAITLVLFWILPLGAAIAAALVAALLVAAKLHDAARRGRLVITAREKDDDAGDVAQDMYRRNAVFHAMWIGLTVSGAGHLHDSGTYVHGQHGGDFGGGFDGGFGDGGGGDAGGI